MLVTAFRSGRPGYGQYRRWVVDASKPLELDRVDAGRIRSPEALGRRKEARAVIGERRGLLLPDSRQRDAFRDPLECICPGLAGLAFVQICVLVRDHQRAVPMDVESSRHRTALSVLGVLVVIPFVRLREVDQ